MSEENNMRILVIGMSGAGKSTLIKSVTGKNVETGIGEGITKEIKSYDSDVWPLTLVDTQGFEFNLFKQLKSVNQIKDYIKKNKGIHAIWYCIDSETKRVDFENIKLLSKSIKGWDNMPLFVVLTKSYSEVDIQTNIKVVEEIFKKSKIKNIKNIIPVVAEERKLNENITIEKTGVEELCLQTIESKEEAVELNIKNNQKKLSKKRIISQSITITSTTTASVIGAVPLNFADAAILVPLETGMVTAILWNYDIKDKKIITTIVGSQGITILAKQAVSALKTLPIIGDIANAVVAGIIVFTLGESVTLLSESIYQGKISTENLEKISKFINEKIEKTPILQEAISYLENNKDHIKDMGAKEILEGIMKNHNNKK